MIYLIIGDDRNHDEGYENVLASTPDKALAESIVASLAKLRIWNRPHTPEEIAFANGDTSAIWRKRREVLMDALIKVAPHISPDHYGLSELIFEVKEAPLIQVNPL